MGGLADSGARAGTMAAAALETAGAKLQSDMLDFVSGGSGQTLAGLLFLLAIVGAIFIFAAGGNYKWGRYLLIAPPLFFFLTQVRIQSNGAEWQFAERVHSRDAVNKVLEGVAGYDGGGRGGADVSLFFQMWNLVVTDVVQYLMSNLNLTASDSDLNLLAKVERYMNHWSNTNILHPETRAFVQLALVNKCADYYMDLKDLASENVDNVQKVRIDERIKARRKEPVFHVPDVAPELLDQNSLIGWLRSHGMEAGTYTCDKLWTEAVKIIKQTEGRQRIEDELTVSLASGEEKQSVTQWFYSFMSKAVSRASGILTEDLRDPAAKAVDEFVARALFREIMFGDRYTAYQNMEGHSGLLQTGRAAGQHGEGAVIATTNNSIQQFSQTEKYQFKGDFVNGALSLPYFQGVLLMLLSVGYPFFAMAMLLPGRVGAILLWMSLWAWVKSWDLGFAVVMMVDNMLYGMFPRGPGLALGEIDRPGAAWVKILEVDPTYTANTYYTIIATCLYAVPILTGFLVARGGDALTGMVSSSWGGYTTGLSTSAANFYRSLQTQTFARNVAIASTNAARQSLWLSINSAPVQQHMQSWAATFRPQALARAATAAANAGHTGEAAEQFATARLSAEREGHMMAVRAHIKSNAAAAAYEASTSPYGSANSESAVATKWYTHDLAQPHPGGQMFTAYLADHYLNQETVANNVIGAGMKLGKGAVGGPSGN